MHLIKLSPTICIGKVILTFSMSTTNIAEDMHFNITFNRTPLVMVTVGNTIFNKIMPKGIDSLGHILFRSEHRWEDPHRTNHPTTTNHPTKNNNAKVIPRGGFRALIKIHYWDRDGGGRIIRCAAKGG